MTVLNINCPKGFELDILNNFCTRPVKNSKFYIEYISSSGLLPPRNFSLNVTGKEPKISPII